jgi:hypothetical protein
MNADQFYSEFASRLNVAAWPGQTTGRTHAVIEALREVGELLAPGCAQYYKRYPNSGEFILDFCCIDSHSHEMLLAAESELSETKVEKVVDDDFQKLVYVKASLKVCVFRSEPEEVLARAQDFLRDYPRHSDAETYIFVRIDWKGKTSGWKLTVGPDGKMPAPVSLS